MKYNCLLFWFIAGVRVVVATVFIPSGILKLQGKRFSAICPEMYAGAFFCELQQTGMYWKFLGFCQLLTALLLFTQRYTVLSALLFFSICTNIFIFTLSVGMHSKAFFMVFMILAAVLLMYWDASRIKLLFNGSPHNTVAPSVKMVPVKFQWFGLVAFILVNVFFILFDKYY